MRRNLLIFNFFLTFNILISLPSDEIWNKIQYYIKCGNIVTNKEKIAKIIKNAFVNLTEL